MLRRLAFVICLVALALGLASTPVSAAPAAATITGRVTAYLLNVRASDSITAKVLERIKLGAIVTIFGKNVRRSWLKVQTADGTIGWVSLVFIHLNSTTLKALPVVS